eukprot:SAG22_NODE_1008_length_6054_cov_11.023678_2_plen_210_part_00
MHSKVRPDDLDAQQLKREVQAAFEQIDTDGSGEIDASEFGTLAASLGLELSAGEVTEAMAAIDTDGSGTIRLPAFESFWRRNLQGFTSHRKLRLITTAKKGGARGGDGDGGGDGGGGGGDRGGGGGGGRRSLSPVQRVQSVPVMKLQPTGSDPEGGDQLLARSQSADCSPTSQNTTELRAYLRWVPFLVVLLPKVLPFSAAHSISLWFL